MDLSSILKLTLIEEIAVAFFDLQSPTDVNQRFKQGGGVRGLKSHYWTIEHAKRYFSQPRPGSFNKTHFKAPFKAPFKASFSV